MTNQHKTLFACVQDDRCLTETDKVHLPNLDLTVLCCSDHVVQEVKSTIPPFTCPYLTQVSCLLEAV